MAGFFAEIRSLLKADYSGRYLCLLLSELAKADPAAFADALHLSPSNRRALLRDGGKIIREYSFLVEGSTRYADLALVAGDKLLIMVEVKEDDVNNPANADQIRRYFEHIRRLPHSVELVHISRYLPNNSDMRAIELARADGACIDCRRYRDLHKALRNHGGELARMTREYLEDIGVASYQPINLTQDGRKLAFMLTEMLGFPRKKGLGKLHTHDAADNAPAIFSTLFANLEIIGEWIRQPNERLFRQRFSRRFTPEQWFDLKAVNKATSGFSDIDAIPGDRGQHVRGGGVSFLTTGTATARSAPGVIKPGGWLAIEAGYCFEITKASEDRDQPVHVGVYAGFYGARLPYEDTEVTRWGPSFPTEEVARRTFARLLERSRKKAAASENGRLYQRALAAFKMPN